MNVFVDEESDSETETSSVDMAEGLELPLGERVLHVVDGATRRKSLRNPKAGEMERMRRVFALLREDSEGATGEMCNYIVIFYSHPISKELRGLEPVEHPAWDENLGAGRTPVRPGTPFQEMYVPTAILVTGN